MLQPPMSSDIRELTLTTLNISRCKERFLATVVNGWGGDDVEGREGIDVDDKNEGQNIHGCEGE